MVSPTASASSSAGDRIAPESFVLTIDESVLRISGVKDLIAAGSFVVDTVSTPPTLRVSGISVQGFWRRPAPAGFTSLIAFGSPEGLDTSIVRAELCFAIEKPVADEESSDDDIQSVREELAKRGKSSER